MREMPEVAHVAAQIEKSLTGLAIERAQINQSPHKFAFFNAEPDEFERALTGETIRGAQANGGMLTINLSAGRLVLADGANIIYYPPEARKPSKHQLCADLSDGGCIALSVAMYGFISYFSGFGDTDNDYYEIAKRAPSPFTDEFTYAHFRSLLQGADARKCSVKEYLATKQRIPGLGNGVLQDILFTAGVNPRRKLDTLSEEKWLKLYQSVKRVLANMLSAGGRDVERDLFGVNGGYQTILSKNTIQKPCPVCSGEIRREAYLGGNVYYCPNCQR